MFKKSKKQTENVKEKKVRTVKVGTHNCVLGGAYRKCKFWGI